MRVRVTKACFRDGRTVDVGEVITVADGLRLPTWMIPVDQPSTHSPSASLAEVTPPPPPRRGPGRPPRVPDFADPPPEDPPPASGDTL